VSAQPDTGCVAFISHSLVHLTIGGELVYSGPSWQADDLADLLERPDFEPAYVAGLLHDAASSLRSERSDGFGERSAHVHAIPDIVSRAEIDSTGTDRRLIYDTPPGLPGAWRRRIAFAAFVAGLIVFGVVAISMLGGAW
jgi:hypothetical protein